MPKKVVFGGYRFLTIFLVAFFVIFGPQNGQNHSGGQARERKKIDKKAALLLRGCFLVFEGATGHVFHRFWVGIGMDFGHFSGWLCDAFLTKKIAVDRLAHPQKSFLEPILSTPLA